MFRITGTVADLRKEPNHPLLETQLLRGEQVDLLEDAGEWLYVEAHDQPRFTDSWHGYRGWLLAAQARLEPSLDGPRHPVTGPHHPLYGAFLPGEGSLAPDLVATARKCLGWPYIWGGLGHQRVDCSGLVHLAFRAAGITLPRNACDQARTRYTDQLCFLGKEEAITHVMLHVHDDLYIEATTQTHTVREIPLSEKLNKQPDLVVVATT